MIQTYIILEKSSNLFKNLKKRNLLNSFDELFIVLEHKPCIGENICLNNYSISEEKNKELRQYLINRPTSLFLKVIGICQTPYMVDKTVISILELKCVEENYKNWKL